MPMTVNYIGVSGKQQSARRFQERYFGDWRNIDFSYNPNDERFAMELLHPNSSCFVWSTNLLMRDAWIPINCKYQLPKPFMICERKLKANPTRKLYERPSYKCTQMFIDLKGRCIRIAMHVSNRQITHRKVYTEAKLDNVLIRIITAWTLPALTGQKSKKLHVIKWIENKNCECYESRDITYMENKMWPSNKCKCDLKYKILTMIKRTRSLIPSMLMITYVDGNFYHVASQCDGTFAYHWNENEESCSHACSLHNNCATNCTLPDCICTPLYHQCARGGCVQRSVVCDGVINCVDDVSDELACNIRPEENAHEKRHIRDELSLCNSFSNETYPNTEICLLVRDRYGVTKHCPNTEHLHYCADFQCPKHYKCLDSYCIPLHTVCDGVKDCPEGQDEDHCTDFTCRGFIRCKGMNSCLHPDYFCNGVIDCPVRGDDELFCDNLLCPKLCKCIGYTVSCIEVTLTSLRYLSIQAQSKAMILIGTVIKSKGIRFNYFQLMQSMDLTGAFFIEDLHPQDFTHMTQLRILDLTNASITLNRESRFTSLNSLRHLYLSRAHAPVLQLDTFQLPNLISLQLQHSGIQCIKNRANCGLTNLKILNISYNYINIIHTSTFLCLGRLDVLDLTHNKIELIAESAFVGIHTVWFTRHLQLCCYVSATTTCQVDYRVMNRTEISNECQPILMQLTWLRIIYGVISVTSTLLSIALIGKVLSKKNKNKSKITTYILAIACSDTLNGLYLVSVFCSDLLNEYVMGKFVHREHLQKLLYYISTMPMVSLITTRLEHLLMTFAMYVATCHVFRHFETHLRIARYISWVVCATYCVVDITLLKHVDERTSAIWQPYHGSDYTIKDVFSIVIIICYELMTFSLMIWLCIWIYISVAKNEKRIQVKRVKSSTLVGKRLVQLTIGRLTIVMFSMSLIALQTSRIGLSVVVKQLLTLLILPTSTIINFVLFLHHG